MSDRETAPPSTSPGDAGSGPGRPEGVVPDGDPVQTAARRALPEEARGIAAGYAFTGPALDLGALRWDGRCAPEAPVRIPLTVLNRHGLVAGATGTGKTSLVEQVVGSPMFKSLARSAGTQIGREITRSLFGTSRRRR
ncbi:helicase HerA-like domain-containing protein [Streptomyces sp. V3I7]|uniref:helicase HerA-like domain-containing protein n=1 Tax=Streptomyces sp. V3I7 TaxID=3042278 RepID=UPI002788629C|nr:Cdc6-like AAA superfamily ATPase [Streptomyces sp. V3I7]